MLTLTDLFCGAGGSSTGAIQVPGVEVRMAANHWQPLHLEAAGHTYDAADPKHAQHGDPNSYYRAWPVDEPMRTLHTIESKALAVPVEGRDGKQATPLGVPLRTQTTRLETALVLERRFEYRTRPTAEPLSTVTANDTSKALLQQPFIAELRGGGSTARPTTRPLATVTAAGNHHALVVPYNSRGVASRASSALPTVTTVDRHALVMRNNGVVGGHPARHTTPATEVVRTLTTAGHQSLLTPGDLAAADAKVDDVLFRMLEPREVIAAMAFPTDYVVLGNRREQVRMAGNAVTPPAARDLIAAVVAAITGEVAA